MVVLPILLALAFTQCEASLQPVKLALQQNDVPRAASLLGSISGQCTESSDFYALTGVTDELSGKTEDAEAAFRQAIALDPKSARLKEQLGAAYLRNKKPAQATEVLREAVALDPENATVKKYLIGAYVGTGSWMPAVSLFDEIGKRDLTAGDPILLLWYAEALIGTRQLSRLDRDLPAASTMPSALLFSLGTLFAQHGLYERAVNYFLEIPAPDADDAVYFNRGLAYSHSDKFKEARESYFLAIDKHPGHVDAYFRVGLDYGAAGNGRKALPWLFRAHDLAPSRADIAYALGEQLIQSGYLDTAREVLSPATAERGADPLLCVGQADLKQASGDHDGAREGYRKVVAQDPEFAPALIGLARADAEKGNAAEARSALMKVLAKDPDDAAANGELGSLDARQGEWAVALPRLRKAWSLNKSNAETALDLSRAERHANRPAEALSVLRAIGPAMQESVAYHLELAQVYAALQRPDNAQAERKVVGELQADAKAGLYFDNAKTYVH